MEFRDISDLKQEIDKGSTIGLFYFYLSEYGEIEYLQRVELEKLRQADKIRFKDSDLLKNTVIVKILPPLILRA